MLCGSGSGMGWTGDRGGVGKYAVSVTPGPPTISPGISSEGGTPLPDCCAKMASITSGGVTLNCTCGWRCTRGDITVFRCRFGSSAWRACSRLLISWSNAAVSAMLGGIGDGSVDLAAIGLNCEDARATRASMSRSLRWTSSLSCRACCSLKREALISACADICTCCT